MMPRSAEVGRGERPPLTRDRVVEAAVAIANADGLRGLSMRRLGSALGVEAMSLYHHVRNKEDLLDGMVDHVYSRITLPGKRQEWRSGMRARCHSAREVLSEYRWAVTLMDSRRATGPGRLRHDNAVLGSFQRAGFGVAATVRAIVFLDAFIYGFALTEASLMDVDKSRAAELASSVLEGLPADQFPHLAAFYSETIVREGFDFRLEFEPCLDLLLDAIERLRNRSGR